MLIVVVLISLAKMQAKSFVGAKLPSATLSTSRHPSVRSRVPLVVRNDSCLIVNTKGGGHAFLGLHLAKKLVSDGHQVTILNDGDQVGVKIDANERLNPALYSNSPHHRSHIPASLSFSFSQTPTGQAHCQGSLQPILKPSRCPNRMGQPHRPIYLPIRLIQRCL